MHGNEGLWAIILAAGDGSRVSALTTDGVGSVVPKQFCSFGGEKTMLRWALDRARSMVPTEHVVVVVAGQHERFWAGELAGVAPENVVVQPHNRGTAAGLLLPLLHVVLRRDAQARILVLPSDHYVADERVLRRALRKAVLSLRGGDTRVVLLGMRPSTFDPEYGWIVPSWRSSEAPSDVSRFAEKPSLEGARDLMERGALVNAFTLLGDASALLGLYEEALPELLGMFRHGLRDGAASHELEELYARIATADFSRDVLERSTHGVSVLPVQECGWSDLGTPARIQMFLSERARREVRSARSPSRAAVLSAATGALPA